MNSFYKFLENKILLEEGPPLPAGGPSGTPTGGPPPMGGMPTPPVGGGMGGMPPPMGGGMGGMPGAAPTSAPQKLKAYNVWEVLEKILDEK